MARIWRGSGAVVAVMVAVGLVACRPEQQPPAAPAVEAAAPAVSSELDEGSLPPPAETPLPANAETPEARDPRWAVPLQVPGLPNFNKVSDTLYRGAQPTAEGVRQLKAMGIKTIVNLRAMHSDRDEIGDVEIGYEHIPMKTWHPEDEDVVRFLRIVSDPDNAPVFVHCQHGADRTGTMCAVYRIAVQGWTRQDAIEEMVEAGYGFHRIWRSLLTDYIRDLDVEAVKRSAGLEAAPAAAEPVPVEAQ